MIGRLNPLPLRFWRSASGQEPVRDWLRELSEEDRKVIGRDMAKVQFRWPLGLPLCRSLGDGLWEIRSSLLSRREARVLCVFHEGELIAVHGFIKKTQKTSVADLALARERWKDMS